MSDERKEFLIRIGGDAPPVLVDTHGRVIRSPETEAEIAALKARIAELEGCATTPSTMSDILWALHAWNYVEHGHAHVSKQQPTPSQTMAMHRINDPRELAAILREQFAKRGIDAREPSEETPGNDGAFITVGPIEGADEDLIEIDRPEQCESFTMKQARKILAGLLVGMDPAETLGDSVGTLRTKPPQFIDVNEHSYVAAHIDLDECVRCQGGIKTHPLISQDGSANVGEYCLACKCSWWHQIPMMPTSEMVRPRKTKAVDE